MPTRAKRIYVDVDDVLSETIERLIELLEETHGRRVAREDVRQFHLEHPFGLDESEIRRFMARAHEDDVIESIRPVDGAAPVLAGWRRTGHRIRLVTGRPPITNAASRRWLARHAIAHDTLHHLDKWARPDWNGDGLPALRFDDLPRYEFDLAVEDSLETAVRLVEDFGIRVALMDRPWNRAVEHLSEGTRAGIVRCESWSAVAGLLEEA